MKLRAEGMSRSGYLFPVVTLVDAQGDAVTVMTFSHLPEPKSPLTAKAQKQRFVDAVVAAINKGGLEV